MGELVLDLVPLLLGVVLSPLAIMALVAVLLSRQARANGVAFLVGWVVAIGAVLTVASVVLQVQDRGAPPLWVPWLKVVLGLVLVGFAVRTYRRGAEHQRAMAAAASTSDVVAAAPQLPKWLHAAEDFSPVGSLALGFGIFVLNPVDASCTVLAALQVQASDVSDTAALWSLVVFGLVGAAPIAVPVVTTLVAGRRAEPWLDTARTWIATHTNVLNAALLLVIGALQLENGISGLLAAN